MESLSLRWSTILSACVACLLVSWGTRLNAQTRVEPSRPLVLVGNECDLECVRRIGGELILVATPYPAEVHAAPLDYDVCNSRALSVRDFTVYLANTRSDCPRERFWRDRLTRDNPSGRLSWIAARRCSKDRQLPFAALRAIEVHRALVEEFPTHRMALDQNLEEELERLRVNLFLPKKFAAVQ